jgi:hypothetical protein
VVVGEGQTAAGTGGLLHSEGKLVPQVVHGHMVLYLDGWGSGCYPLAPLDLLLCLS